MRRLTDKFQISNDNGVTWHSLYAPDQDMSFDYEDIDSSDAGRTEDGVMHRSPVRYKVGKYGFKYSQITEPEKNAMEALFIDAPTFLFKRPSRLNSNEYVVSECYRSKCSISWRNAITGNWSGYSFNIIEC